MPDDDSSTQLPALLPQPDAATVPPEMLGQLQHASQWAGTFGGSDTNIAERSRHNADIQDYATALDQQRQAAQAAAIQTNQTAQNLYFNSLRLNMQNQEAQMRMQHANEMAPLNIQLKQAQILAEGAAEKRRATEATAQAQDSAGFSQAISDGISSGQVKPQGPGWGAFLANTIASFPNTDPRVISRYGPQMFPGEELTPEQYVSKAVALKQQATAGGLQNTQVRDYKGNPIVVEGAPAKRDPIAEFQDALASSHPVYGAGDGTNFKPTDQGAAQTHVQTTFVSPAGKATTQVFPRDFFDSMVSASKARQGSPSPAPAAAPAVTSPVPAAAQPIVVPAKSLDIHDQARAAIRAGASPAIVTQRLLKLGGDPSKL